MKALQVTEHGKPTHALQVMDIERPERNPGEMLIRVGAASLNFNDLDRCYGRLTSVPLTPPFTLGMDVCGEVVEADEEDSKWIGERVVAITSRALGGMAEYAVAGRDSVFPVPSGMSDAQAAAFIIPFHTMHLALHRRAAITSTDTVLIHAGASSLGLAGIQLAKAAGARVIATVGHDNKRAVCEQSGADLTINYREEDFSDLVLKETDEQGASLVCDLVGGDSVVEKSWQCVAAEGRYVALGFADDPENGMSRRALRPLCAANFSVIGVMLAWGTPPIKELRRFGFSMFPRDVALATHSDLCRLYEAGSVYPSIGAEIPVSEAGKALEAHEQRLTTGKTVVTEFDWDG